MPQGFENFVPLFSRKQSLFLSDEDLWNASKRRGNHRDVHVKTNTEANKLANRQQAHYRWGTYCTTTCTSEGSSPQGTQLCKTRGMAISMKLRVS